MMNEEMNLHRIAEMVYDKLLHADRAALLSTKEHNVKVIALLSDMEPKDRQVYFKDQAFPTYQEAELIINYKYRKIAQLKRWKAEAEVMGYFEDVKDFDHRIEIWETAISIWIDVRTAATNIFDAMWKLGISEVYPSMAKKEDGILAMFGGAAKSMVGRAKRGTKDKPENPRETAQRRRSADFIGGEADEEETTDSETTSDGD